jgi:hypothetical protein
MVKNCLKLALSGRLKYKMVGSLLDVSEKLIENGGLLSILVKMVSMG